MKDRECALDEACAFLEFVLADGPMMVPDIQKEAKAAGHAWPTVQRAKVKNGIYSKKSDFHKGWRWKNGPFEDNDDPGQPLTLINMLDSVDIEIPCTDCGRKTKKSIGWIKSHSDFICACGTTIKLDASQFESELAKVERSLSNLQRTIKGLNKK